MTYSICGGSDQPEWIAFTASLLDFGRQADLNLNIGRFVSFTLMTAISDWTNCGLPLPLLILKSENTMITKWVF